MWREGGTIQRVRCVGELEGARGAACGRVWAVGHPSPQSASGDSAAGAARARWAASGPNLFLCVCLFLELKRDQPQTPVF